MTSNPRLQAPVRLDEQRIHHLSVVLSTPHPLHQQPGSLSQSIQTGTNLNLAAVLLATAASHRSIDSLGLSPCRRDRRNGRSHGSRFHQQLGLLDWGAAHRRHREPPSIYPHVLTREKNGGFWVVGTDRGVNYISDTNPPLCGVFFAFSPANQATKAS